MEEKKLDINSIIGFLLIGGILLYMLWQNQPTPEQLAAQEEAKQEQIASEAATKAAELTTNTDAFSNPSSSDSLALARFKNTVGDFAYALTLPSATSDITRFENELLALKTMSITIQYLSI
jgi:YidC/Oxa1 family membrane protein insertase